ncbi:MAG: hypothetical protein KAJ19_13340 [Gammaproteobacteria bacterium]|nr:hypothetical protein [Gammaproteobacteria bacterium]
MTNKKIWFTGGEPDVNIDDLQRNVDAVFRSYDAMFGAFNIGTNLNYRVVGCEVTIIPGVSCTVTEGYIWLNDEIVRVDAQVAPYVSSDQYYFEKLVTYDPDGDKVYNDLVARETWQINRGNVVNGTGAPLPANVLDVNGFTMPDKIKQIIEGNLVEKAAESFSILNTDELVRAGISGAGNTWIMTVPDTNIIASTEVFFLHFYDHAPGTGYGTYEIRTVGGFLITTVFEPTFLMYVNDQGTIKEFWRLSLVPVGAPISFDLGPWDMDATAAITIAHGLLDKNLIRSVQATIINDAGDTLWSFSNMNGGWFTWDDTNVVLTREASGGGLNGHFDSTDFNDGVINRGFLLIFLFT